MRIIQWLIRKYDDLRWDYTLWRHPEPMIRMAEQAQRDYEAGLTVPIEELLEDEDDEQ